MISYFFSPEKLSDNNSYFCDICKQKSKLTTKMTTIKKLPPIQIMTIKRFQYNREENIKKKLFKNVKYFYNFDLCDIFPDLDGREKSISKNFDDSVYHLHGIIIHSVYIIFKNILFFISIT